MNILGQRSSSKGQTNKKWPSQVVNVTSFIDYYGLQSVAWRVIWGLCVCLMIGQLVLSFLFLSTHIVYWMQAYSSMCGQCNTVRRLLRLYVLTCWMGTYRLFWAIVSICSCLFYLVVACSEAVWFVQWIKHLGTGLLLFFKKKNVECSADSQKVAQCLTAEGGGGAGRSVKPWTIQDLLLAQHDVLSQSIRYQVMWVGGCCLARQRSLYHTNHMFSCRWSGWLLRF